MSAMCSEVAKRLKVQRGWFDERSEEKVQILRCYFDLNSSLKIEYLKSSSHLPFLKVVFLIRPSYLNPDFSSSFAEAIFECITLA